MMTHLLQWHYIKDKLPPEDDPVIGYYPHSLYEKITSWNNVEFYIVKRHKITFPNKDVINMWISDFTTGSKKSCPPYYWSLFPKLNLWHQMNLMNYKNIHDQCSIAKIVSNWMFIMIPIVDPIKNIYSITQINEKMFENLVYPSLKWISLPNKDSIEKIIKKEKNIHTNIFEHLDIDP